MSDENKPSLTQQMLSVARQVVAGRASPDTLGSMLEQLGQGTAAAQSQFINDAEGNPEVPQEAVSEVLAAFGEYDQGLQAMMSGLSYGDMQAMWQGAQIVDRASARIRAAQEHYQDSLQKAGPTPFPYINRVLVHIQYLLDGGTETRFCMAALAELPFFRDRVVQDLHDQAERGHDNPEAQGQVEGAVNDICEMAENFYRVLQQQWAYASAAQQRQFLQELKHGLLQASEHLSSGLSQFVQQDLATGPTPILMINLVIRAAENLYRGTARPMDFIRMTKQAEMELNNVSASFSGDAQDTLRLLISTLGDMRAAAEDYRFTDLIDTVPMIRTLADELSALASIGSNPEWDEDDALLDFVHGEDGGGRRVAMAQGLPANLQAVLDATAGALAGRVSQAEALGSCDELSRLIEQTRGKARSQQQTLGQNLMEPVEQGLALLEEAVESLRIAIIQNSHQALEAGRGLMSQAADILMHAMAMPVE